MSDESLRIGVDLNGILCSSDSPACTPPVQNPTEESTGKAATAGIATMMAPVTLTVVPKTKAGFLLVHITACTVVHCDKHIRPYKFSPNSGKE